MYGVREEYSGKILSLDGKDIVIRSTMSQKDIKRLIIADPKCCKYFYSIPTQPTV